METGLDPTRLELELTESALIENSDVTIQLLTELRTKGVRISLDDFGTGYSSLTHLQRLPLSALKIDGSFIREITSNPGDAAIVSNLISLAHSLGLGVIAEEVETPAQLEFLRSKKCDEVQGWVITPPLDAEACARFLSQPAPLPDPFHGNPRVAGAVKAAAVGERCR